MANLKLIVELAEKHRLPAIYTLKRFVESGGLMSYGIDLSAVGHNISEIIGRQSKRGEPGDLPQSW